MTLTIFNDDQEPIRIEGRPFDDFNFAQELVLKDQGFFLDVPDLQSLVHLQTRNKITGSVVKLDVGNAYLAEGQYLFESEAVAVVDVDVGVSSVGESL